jgi:hypothetical protein
MPASRPLELERLHYWQGQSLRSRDARSETAAADHLRWWHTRALHGAFGIASGLEIQVTGGDVTVNPGLAYDGFGRELLLLAPFTIAVPGEESRSEAMLTISSHDRAEQQGCSCGSKAAAASPTLAWESAGEIDLCQSVPLARWRKSSSARIEPVRRYARRSARPRIAAASTVPGGTGWTTWSAGGQVVGFQAAVDTSAAGFTRTPCYFAGLEVAAASRVRQARTAEELASAAWLFLLGFTHVADASARGFSIRTVIPPRVAGAIRVSSPLLAVMRHLVTVRWLAVEAVENQP